LRVCSFVDDLAGRQADLGRPVGRGLIVAAMAAYLSCAELCEAAYRREVLPVWPLVKH
jgi:hypothetical protein